MAKRGCWPPVAQTLLVAGARCDVCTKALQGPALQGDPSGRRGPGKAHGVYCEACWAGLVEKCAAERRLRGGAT